MCDQFYASFDDNENLVFNQIMKVKLSIRFLQVSDFFAMCSNMNLFFFTNDI